MADYDLSQWTMPSMKMAQPFDIRPVNPRVAAPPVVNPAYNMAQKPFNIADWGAPDAGMANAPTISRSDFMNPDGSAVKGAGLPPAAGGWTDAAGFGLGLTNVGLGVWGALETQKMNEFMREHYGEQAALQRTDFANRARSTNQAIRDREAMRASAAGHRFGSAESEARIAQTMDKWGVDEDF